MKVLIDANLWISFIIGKVLKGLEDYMLDGIVDVIISDEQLSEILKVLGRPKFKKYFSDNDIVEFLSLIHKTTRIIKTNKTIDVCRDKKDNFILDAAVSGKVEYIITGDKDLIVLSPFRGIKIIGFKEFENIMNELKRSGH